jgi:phosphatidylserine/phosphatidylglycerophosphate/cardiolipin synthase-like enzyme
MKNIYLLSSILFTLTSAFAAQRVQNQVLSSYFNYNSQSTYLDPYRNFERSGDNLEQVILDTLALAKREVVVAVHELRLPNVALKLRELSEAGIVVKVIVDNSYNNTIVDLIGRSRQINDDDDSNQHDVEKYNDLFSLIDINQDGKITKAEQLKRDAIYILQQAAIELKDDSFDNSNGSGLMHHKFVVIDRKITLTSSANFTLSCIHGDFTNKNSRGNRNAMMVIRDANVAQAFLQEFNLMWGSEKNVSLFGVNKPFRGAQAFELKDGTQLKLQFSPSPRSTLSRFTTNGLISQEVAKAKESVDAGLFVFSEQKISNALKLAMQNGAKMNFLVEAKFAYRYYSELLDLWGLSLIRTDTCEFEDNNNPWSNGRSHNGGVANLTSGDVLHHKFAVVDAQKVIFGSHNWSESADFLNDEFLLVVDHAETAGVFLEEHSQLSERARYGAPQTLLERIDQSNDYCSYFF